VAVTTAERDTAAAIRAAALVAGAMIAFLVAGRATREALFLAHALSLSAQKPSPGGSIRPFWEPATVTSTSHSSWR